MGMGEEDDVPFGDQKCRHAVYRRPEYVSLVTLLRVLPVRPATRRVRLKCAVFVC